MWKLKQIFDGEYGCEERQPGEKEKCLVILANEEGEEKTFEANEDWIAAIEKLSANPLMKIIISKPMAKDCQYKKIVVEKKGDGYQAAKYTEKQVFHDNFGVEDLQGYLMEVIHDTFLQVNAWDETKEYSLLISKKGAVTLRAKASKEAPDTVTEHNRKKNYILDEGQVIPPLVDMGIFTGEGKVVKSMYDKFRQINRFIEMIDDAIREYKGEEIHIIDFGCGKSYLTFIMYYYFTEIRHMKVQMLGLDLKKDVIEKCNRANLLECCGYKTQLLEFIDFEHTPKNILIRAVRRPVLPSSAKKKYLAEVENMCREFHLEPTLYTLLRNDCKV